MSSTKMKLAELVNGRAAMFGCSVIALSAIATKVDLIKTAIPIDIQSLWWAIGIYAG